MIKFLRMFTKDHLTVQQEFVDSINVLIADIKKTPSSWNYSDPSTHAKARVEDDQLFKTIDQRFAEILSRQSFHVLAFTPTEWSYYGQEIQKASFLIDEAVKSRLIDTTLPSDLMEMIQQQLGVNVSKTTTLDN